MALSSNKIINGCCTAFAWLLTLLPAFFIGRCSKEFERGLFPPDFASDKDVRSKIESLEISIPASASRLAYLRDGFEEPSFYVTMEVAPEDRDRLFAAWLKSDRSKWSSVFSDQMANYDPAALHLRNLDVSCFSFADLAHLSGYSFSDDPRQYERVVLFEENGRKVLLFYWHE